MGEDTTMFPSRLRRAMKSKGIKQKDLAKKAGLNESTLSNYLSGKRHATDKNMYALATALNVDIRWLMGYRDDVGDAPDKITIERMELRELVERVSDEDVPKVIQFIQMFVLK